jgi:predicted DsbA family dithiol-disulfide isomerase
MLVEIFSDVVCPWCAVGKRRFETALSKFDHADEVEVVWRAFELDAHAPQVREGDMVQHLADKYGMSREKAVAANENLTKMAAVEGLEFHLDAAVSGNTFDAHRLLHYAHEVGLQDQLKEAFFQAYFRDGLAIGTHEVLAEVATEVGLDPVVVKEILTTDRFAAEVRADEAEALEIGVSGVPFFVVDHAFGLPGAQDPETILNVLNRAWTKSHPLTMVETDGAASCDGDSCAI